MFVERQAVSSSRLGIIQSKNALADSFRPLMRSFKRIKLVTRRLQRFGCAQCICWPALSALSLTFLTRKPSSWEEASRAQAKRCSIRSKSIWIELNGGLEEDESNFSRQSSANSPAR